MLVGLISDTHGLLRPEALAALQGSQLIVHAGDIGKPEILDELRTIAPTFAVRGNNDSQAWAAALPEKEIVEVAGGIRLRTSSAGLSATDASPSCSDTRTSRGSRPAMVCCTSIRAAPAHAASGCR